MHIFLRMRTRRGPYIAVGKTNMTARAGYVISICHYLRKARTGLMYGLMKNRPKDAIQKRLFAVCLKSADLKYWDFIRIMHFPNAKKIPSDGIS